MDFEKFLLDALEGVSQIDFAFIFRFTLSSTLILWFFVALWVWKDSGERMNNILVRILFTIFVAPLNLLGLFIYMLVRPKLTLEEEYWADLEKRYLLYETAELVDCPRCSYMLRPGFNVCPNCAFRLKQECRNCGVLIDRDWKYCPECGVNALTFVPKHGGDEMVQPNSQSSIQNVETSLQELQSQREVVHNDLPVAQDLTQNKDRPTQAEGERITAIDHGFNNQSGAAEGDKSYLATAGEYHEMQEKFGELKTPLVPVKTDFPSKLGGKVLRGVYTFGERVNLILGRSKGVLNSGGKKLLHKATPKRTSVDAAKPQTKEESSSSV